MSDATIQLSECFYSIQGESTRMGLPCFFIRVAGCNLRCAWCDSSYTWEEPGRRVPVDEILAMADQYPNALVELTGGEPLLQKGCYDLMDMLLARKRSVLVETNGTISIELVPAGAGVIMDIKCPGSGMADLTDWDNIERLKKRSPESGDEIKFVLASADDFHWAADVIERYSLDRIAPILFSPVESSFSGRKLAEMILRYNPPVRLQLQMHRILWPELERGI
ncbi:MAG: radical SAM protein [Desulfobulbaceae bacterium]